MAVARRLLLLLTSLTPYTLAVEGPLPEQISAALFDGLMTGLEGRIVAQP